MKKLAVTVAVAAFCMTSGTAFAGGWGKGGSFLNLSPSLGIGVGDVNVLNGIGILNGSPILSGNNVSGILSRNNTGILQGIGIDILSGKSGYKSSKRKRH